AGGRARFVGADGTEAAFNQVPACPRCGYERREPLHPRMFSFNSHQGACKTCDGLGEWRGKVCSRCGGNRLKPESLAGKIGGTHIIDLTRRTVVAAQEFLGSLHLTGSQTLVAEGVVRELRQRLGFLLETGLGYLTLDRETSTLSGGEAQRIRLASQVGLG